VDTKDIPNSISRIYNANNFNAQDSALINLKRNGELATLDDYGRKIIKYAIKKFGSFNTAGKALGITHKTVASKARKYNLI